MLKKSSLFLLILGLLFSCQKDKEEQVILAVESTLVSKGDLYGNGGEGITKQNLVITDQNTWQNLVAQMDAVNAVSDQFAVNTIDFSTHSIIAVFDEVKGSGGHHLDLNISSNSEAIFVQVHPTAPSGNVTGVMTQPYYIVMIPQSDLPVVFN